MCQMFGGPSVQEEQNADQTQSFANVLNSDFSTQFQGQQNALGVLQNYTQRIATGDTGRGFSPELHADLANQIVNQGAANARNITQATQNAGAGQIFQGSTDTSGLARARGTSLQLKEQALSGAANQTATGLNNLNIADVNAGRENLLNATTQQQGVVKKFDPTSYARLAGGELQQAGADYTHINQEKTEKAQAIAKLAMSAVTMAATGGIGGIAGMGAMGGGFGGFLKAGANALSGGANPFSAPSSGAGSDTSVPGSDTVTADALGGLFG
jgi:hypothetical protein